MRREHWLAGAAACALIGLSGGPAAAQATAPGPAAPTTVQEVVVTGSLIAGAAKTTALPVDVISQDAIEKRGAPTVMEMIRDLPATGAILGEANTINAAGQGFLGTSTVNLRGLGPNRTLVLLNGRRLAPYSTGIVDTNLMPLAAVERVEVLKDGAAATYGSDAMAGVVNFITRKNFDGLELKGDYSFIQGTSGDYNLGGVYGWNNERLNVLVSAGYERRAALSPLNRNWAIVPYLDNPQGGYSGNANPGSFYRVSPTGAVLAGPVVDPQCAVLGNVQLSSSSCLYQYQKLQNLVEAQQRYQLYASVDYRLTDRISFHGEGLYAHTDQVSQQAPAYTPLQYPTGLLLNPGGVAVPNRYVIPCNNPGLQDMFAQNPGFAAAVGGTGCLNAPNAPANSYVAAAGWRLMGVGGDILTGRAKPNERKVAAYRLSGGLHGELGADTSWDLAVTYMRDIAPYYADDQLVDRNQLALQGFGGPNCTGTTPGANGCLWLNPFSNGVQRNVATGVTNPQYKSSVANSADLIRWLTVPFYSRTTNELLVYDALLSGKLPVFELPGGRIGWAVGAQYRENKIRTLYGAYNNLTVNPCIDSVVNPATTCAIPQGPLNFSPSSTPVNLSQDVKAAFGEIDLPVLDTLNFQAALRYEDYGGGVGSTVNPKLAGKWQMTPWLAVRGSVGTTFRGPTPLNVDPNKSTTLNPVTAAGGTSKGIDYYGNPNLHPETALNTNLGLLFQTGRFTATLDYWRFHFKDSIVAPPFDAIATSVVPTPLGLANCSAALRNLVTFDNGNSCVQGVTTGANILRVRSDLINGPQVKTSGIDFDATYRMGEVLDGDLTFSASGSYLLDYTVGDTFVNGVLVLKGYEAAGFLNDDRGGNSLPRFKAYLRADYSFGNQNLGAGLRYVSSYKDNRTLIFTPASPLGKKIDETVLVDVNYRVALNHATLTVSLDNLFDRTPSFARTAYSYDTFVGDPLGRVIKIGLTTRF